LLAFSRKQVLQLEVLDLGEEARQVGQMLPRVLSEDIRLEIDVPDEPVWVKADASQLEQVLLNLAINARDAMPRGGELMISAERVDYDGELGARMPELATGPYGVLRVRDTGEGIDPQIAGQIFEPFFTTKAPGEGTGLGLSTVHGIVKQSGGDISVESKLGEGTVFSIYLPLAEMPLEAPAPEEAAAMQVPQAGTVLVVEDEEGVRQVVEMDLREMGFTVLSASDLPQALALSRAHPGRIDLLLTDVVLPGGDGTQVHDAIAAERPDIRVLYMSGYAQSQIARRQGWDARAPFLEKPFRPGQLADKVKQVLMM
jgi:CheY-like chemotaxis protein